MSALGTDLEGAVLQCPACGQKNRVAWAHLAEAGKCGKCGGVLPVVAAPIEIASEEVFAALVGGATLPVVVDFWASWCGPCLMVAPELEKVAEQSAGRLVVAKVNTEELPGLSQRFSVRSIPTMALFAGGKEVGRTMGARPAAGILEFIEQELAKL